MNAWNWVAANVVLMASVGIAVRGAEPQSQSTATDASAERAASLPADVYPDSEMRLPSVRREDLDDYGKEVYDRFSDPGSPVPLRGPNSIRMYSPLVADHYYTVNQYLRTLPGQGNRLAELAILNAAREASSPYEWSAHESAAQRAGLEQEIIDIVKYRKDLPEAGVVKGLGEKETLIIRLARAMFRDQTVGSALFSDARQAFGDRGMVELVSLMAHYSATAVLLNTFGNVPAPSPNSALPMP